MDLDTLVVILAGGEGTRLWPLTAERTKPAVPFGGKYRLVDIPLSNAFNSGLYRIYVLTQGKDFSFNKHIDNAWYIDSIDGFVTRISPQMTGGQYWGDADAVRQITKYIERENPDIVLIIPGDSVVKMNYMKFAEFLASTPNADAAISIVEKPLSRAGELGSVAIDSNSWIADFREKDPNTPLRASKEDVFFASMGTYAFKTEVLLDILKTTQDKLFGKEIIPKLIKSSGKVLGYNFSNYNNIPGYEFDPITFSEKFVERTKDSDYWEDVGQIKEYHDAHMDLVGVVPLFNIHSPIDPGHYEKTKSHWPLRTAVMKGLGPGKIVRAGNIRDVIINDGVILSAVNAYQCVFSPKVRVEDSTLERCVIFDGAEIRGCNIRNAIIDKNARLEEVEIGYDSQNPIIHVDESGVNIVPRHYGREDFNK